MRAVTAFSFALCAISSTLAAPATISLEARREPYPAVVQDLADLLAITKKQTRFMFSVNNSDFDSFYDIYGEELINYPLALGANLTACFNKIAYEVPNKKPNHGTMYIEPMYYGWTNFTAALKPWNHAIQHNIYIYFMSERIEQVQANVGSLMADFDQYASRLQTVLPTKVTPFKYASSVGHAELAKASTALGYDGD